MPASDAKIKANAKYNKNHYDSMLIRIKKGKKEIITEHAKKHDGSLNKFLNRAVDETIERDNEKDNNE